MTGPVRGRLIAWVSAASFALAPAVSYGQSTPSTPPPAPTPTPTPTPTPVQVRMLPRPMPAPAYRPLYPNYSSDAPTITITGRGTVYRKADRAMVTLSVSLTGAAPEETITKGAAASIAVQRALERFSGVRVNTTNAFLGAGYTNGTVTTYNWSRQLEVTVDDLASIARIRTVVASTPGVTFSSLRYDVRDRSTADAEAVTQALADINAQVAAITNKTGLRILGLRQLQVGVQFSQQADDSDRVPIAAYGTAVYEVATP